MAQAGDVQLGASQYMIEPGSYRRLSDGAPEGRPGRWTMNDFIGGQQRAIQLERETSWDGRAVGPTLGGQGIQPWPLRSTHRDSAIGTVTSARRVLVQQVGKKLFVGHKQYIYEAVNVDNPTWATLVQRADLGAGHIVTGLTEWNGYLVVALGNTGILRLIDSFSYVVTTPYAGTYGRHIFHYAGRLVFSDPLTGNENVIRLQTGGSLDHRSLDSDIMNMCLHQGAIAIATRQNIYLLTGKGDPTNSVWLGEPTPIFASGAYSDERDYIFLQSYGGRLYTWLFGQVMEWQPNTGSNRQGWRAIGLDGRNCYGATVTNGLLVVSILSNEGYYELWAWDGTGCWCMDRTNTAAYVWPANTSGAGNVDLLTFINNDADVDYYLYRLKPRSLLDPAYATSGNFDTALIDAGERDKLKAWRTIAAYFAMPEIKGNPSSSDTVTIRLHYSTDCGSTWTTAHTITPSDPTVREHIMSVDLGSGAKVSRYLQLRVEWQSVNDWTPILVGLMAEYELLDQPSRRRRWQFSVRPRDTSVLRDGNGVDPRTGQQIAADLWNAWQNGTTIAMRDVDYDLNPVTYQVRVTGIAEERDSTADSGRWTDSRITLTLVEI